VSSIAGEVIAAGIAQGRGGAHRTDAFRLSPRTASASGCSSGRRPSLRTESALLAIGVTCSGLSGSSSSARHRGRQAHLGGDRVDAARARSRRTPMAGAP
jgi:hypothetical protein